MNNRKAQLLQMLESEPNDLFLKYALAMECLGEENQEQAATIFNEIIGADTSYTAAYYQLGQIFVQQGKEAEALHLFQTGLHTATDQRTKNEFQSAIDNLLY